MDFDIFRAINNFAAAHDALEDPLRAYVQASEILFVLGLAALFLFLRPEIRRAAVAAVFSAVLALTAAHFVADAVGRARPFAAHHGVHLFIAHARDPGFPSDHATGAFAIAFALLFRQRALGVVALAMAIVLSIGRVAMGVHYPSDVLAGAVLGLAAAAAVWAPPLRARIDRVADALGGLPVVRSVVRPV
jgi:undecaprenyl-diphosphatase